MGELSWDGAAALMTVTATDRRGEVYDRIKAMVMSHELKPARRIRPGPLADRLKVSTVPVREALIELAAQGLIRRDRHNGGFFAKEVSESEIRDLYRFNANLLSIALNEIETEGTMPAVLKPPKIFDMEDSRAIRRPSAAVETMEALFLSIARQSGSESFIRTVVDVNDRCQIVRRHECKLNKGLADDLAALCRDHYRGNIDALRGKLNRFHEDGIRRLPNTVYAIKEALKRESADRDAS